MVVEPRDQQDQGDHEGGGKGEIEIIRHELREQRQEIADVGAARRHFVDQPQRPLQHHHQPDADRDRDERPGDAADQIEVEQARAQRAGARASGKRAAGQPCPRRAVSASASRRLQAIVVPHRPDAAPGSAGTISARKNQSGLPSTMLTADQERLGIGAERLLAGRATRARRAGPAGGCAGSARGSPAAVGQRRVDRGGARRSSRLESQR